MSFLLSWDRVLGAIIGGILAWCALMAMNQIVWLPQAREDGRARLIAEQAAQAQREELERKGDDAKLQRMSDYDLCVAYLGGVPECDSLRLLAVPEE